MTPYTPNKPVPPEKLPRAVCLDALPQFTAPYFQVYVDAITNYYAKYPKDPGAGVPLIMLELASHPGLTPDQIHAKFSGDPKRD